jgi:membrane-associated phospholipid phosphatase
LLGLWLALCSAPVRADAGQVADMVPPTAAASPGPRLRWHEDWPRFRPIGYALTAASVLGALGVTLFIDYPDDARWRGGILFDDAVRGALRAHDPAARDAIRRASDFTLISNIVQVGLVDGIILPLLDHSPRVAVQVSLINAQAFALNTLIATVLFKVVARERPLVADCRRDPNFDPLCKVGSYAGFPSSHASTAFTAAGLSCVHHAYLPLYGSPAGDTAACAGAIGLATATSLFRVIGDRHYLTDVLFGAALGFSLGYVYPWLFHYRADAPKPLQKAAAAGGVTWTVLPTPTGLTVSGVL